MAAPVLFSHHSSNPLEVPTSDPLNVRYKEHLKQQQKKDPALAPSSDDPLNGYQVEEYQNHIFNLFPGITPKAKRSNFEPALTLAERGVAHEQIPDNDSDDELEIVHSDHDEIMQIKPVEFPIEVDDDDILDGVDDVPPDTLPDEEPDELDEPQTDEEMTIFLKSSEERDEIEEEIAEIEEAVPQLAQDYKIVDRLGTGTFSSVYKALDLHYETKWHNGTWQGRHPPSSSAYYQSASPSPGAKVFVAIKRIYVTSNPERIRNEITILEDSRGCRHVSQLITAFRHRDQVVAVMPYHKNDDFRDFYRTLPMSGIKAYFRSLLRALRDIHSRGIIHRDVKPANFLFDSRTYIGTLCDFGLACRIDFDAKHGQCLHTAPSRQHLHGAKKSSKLIDTNLVKAAQREARQKSAWSSDRVGYPEKDMRPHSKANRAGTRGFRAPEVLFKCNEQTGAIDIWSAGMILLFFLTGKFPLFQSNDDIEALMEIAAIIGRRKMESAATLHNRTFATNVPSVTRDGMAWREFVEKNNPSIFDVPSPPSSPSSSPSVSQNRVSDPDSYIQDLELAFDLLEKLLLPESINRITAREALYHPFLAESTGSSSYSSSSSATSSSLDTDVGDDAFFPHPLGGGRCGKYHFVDEVTEEHRIRIPTDYGDVIRLLQSGEGIPIGNQPCEFHADLEEFQDYPQLENLDFGNESSRDCEAVEQELGGASSSTLQ
ncbi:CDC7 [Sanghuangporus sanghuang]